MASQYRIQLAATVIQQGGVIAYPTEAVWGLGCDPYNSQAVRKILALKNRPEHKGLILIADSKAAFAPLLATISPQQMQQLDDTWPGPNTWLVPHHNRVPSWVTGQFDTVAIRVTNHPDVIALCRAVGGPIISTSANPQGLEPARHAGQAKQYFANRIDGILPGKTGGLAQPSVIRDLATNTVIRSA